MIVDGLATTQRLSDENGDYFNILADNYARF